MELAVAKPARNMSAAQQARKKKIIEQRLASTRRGRQGYEARIALWQDMSYEAQLRLRTLIASENEAIALAAIKETLDRAEGKPRQAVQIDHKTDLTALHLDALRQFALSATPQAPEMIDVSPVHHGET